MVEAVAGLFAIALMILRFYLADKAKREAKTYENDTAAFDKALDVRDADRLSAAFDELRLPGPAGEGDLGRPDDPDAAKRQL